MHIVRGSASCSLVAYLLGISNLDPVEHNISVARFMNNSRLDLPDIDLDVPYNKRDELYIKIYEKWPGKVARISNRINYKKKSAIRQAIRLLGLPSNISRNANIKRLYPRHHDKIVEIAERLVGKTAHHSLHCGGLVFFDEGVPKHLMLDKHQVCLNKDDVERKRLLKIDILCNRGLAQLADIDKRCLTEYPEDDQGTIDLLCTGDVMGLTFAESPTFTKAVLSIKPKNRKELALALGLIRPAAASKGKKRIFIRQWQNRRDSSQLVFEDDVLYSMVNKLQLTFDEADYYRKGFAGDKEDIKAEFSRRFRERSDLAELMESYSQFKYYSFCHSHALIYAHLVWALAYHKKHSSGKFWEATLNHCSSMYRPWVHACHALNSGLELDLGHPIWSLSKERLKKTAFQGDLFGRTAKEEFVDYGYWTDKSFFPTGYLQEDCGYCTFKGIIACYRVHGDNTFVTISPQPMFYIDLIIKSRLDLHGIDMISGAGEIQHDDSGVITVVVAEFEFSQLTEA